MQSDNIYGYKGFLISYTASSNGNIPESPTPAMPDVPEEPEVPPASPGECGPAVLTAQTGEILSPYYPSKYPVNIACTWSIRAGVGQVSDLSLNKSV